MASRWRRAGLAPAFVVLAWAVVVASAEAEPVVQLEVPTSDVLPPVVAFEGPRGGSLNPVPIGRRRIPRHRRQIRPPPRDRTNQRLRLLLAQRVRQLLERADALRRVDPTRG